MPLASFDGSPCANTRASFETEPFEIHIFRPRSTHESPSRLAVVRSFVASLPTSGSVRPKHPMISPLQREGSQRCFCSSVPNFRMVISTSEIWTDRVVRTDESARPTSSVTSACETKSSPMPPYFSGTGPPSRPSGAIFRSTSLGKVSPRSRSRAPGAISLSAKSFASLRMDCCSGERSKSTRSSLETIRAADGHPPRGLGERREAVLRVEPVRVSRRQKHITQSLQLGVRHDRIHERLPGSHPAVRLENEDVAQPAERRAIRHHARESDLRCTSSRVAVEDREAERSVDSAIHHVPRHACGPVRLVVKEAPHEVAVDVSRVARNDVLPHARRV